MCSKCEPGNFPGGKDHRDGREKIKNTFEYFCKPIIEEFMLTENQLSQGKAVKSLQKIQSEVENINRIALSVDCVIFGFDESKLKVLLIRSDLKK